MTKQRATFSSFCNSSEACQGLRMGLKVQPGPCSPSVLQPELVGWALPLAVHSQTNFEVCQCSGRGFCPLCMTLYDAPQQQPAPRSPACPRVPQGLQERRGWEEAPCSEHRGLSSALCHLHVDKGAPLKQRGLRVCTTAPNVISSTCTLVKSSTAHLVLDISS